MNAERILITHRGYTVTAYSSCGAYQCSMAILWAVGVPKRDAADPESVWDLHLADDVQVACGLLGESDSDEWCAACGDFIRHGLNCGCEDTETDREPLSGPHVNLWNAPEMAAFR